MKNSSEVSNPALVSQGTRKDSDTIRMERCSEPGVHSDHGAARSSSMPSTARVKALADLFSVLANETRLKLLLALRGCADTGRGELCVCDLAALAGASESMTSHQLKLLRDAGLVRFRRDGKFARYALSDGPQGHILEDALEHTSRPAGSPLRSRPVRSGTQQSRRSGAEVASR